MKRLFTVQAHVELFTTSTFKCQIIKSWDRFLKLENHYIRTVNGSGENKDGYKGAIFLKLLNLKLIEIIDKLNIKCR